jgi:hypothetical protein
MSDEDPHQHLKDTVARIKANGFFLVGTLLYLPPTIADVVSEGGEVSASTQSWYKIVMAGGMLAFLANGIFETWVARRAYKDEVEEMQQKQQQQRVEDESAISVYAPPNKNRIFNGLLFTVAAFLEIMSAGFGRHTFLIFSGIFYLCNALLTIWLRRSESTSSAQSDKLVRLGDILFLIGSILDLAAYISVESPNDAIGLLRDKRMALISAIAWFADAILYLVADKILLDQHRSQSTASRSTTPADGLELAEVPVDSSTGEGGDKRLSPLV